jgi:hypothetical protein
MIFGLPLAICGFWAVPSFGQKYCQPLRAAALAAARRGCEGYGKMAVSGHFH